MKLLGLVILAAAIQIAAPAKILCILPVGVKSHSILFDRLLKELAQRGHEITYLTPFKSSSPTKNIKEIIIPDAKYVMMGNNTSLFMMRHIPGWVMFATLPYMSANIVHMVMETEEVQKLMESNETFDLIFGEPYMDEALLAGFSHKYQAPIVTLSTFIPNVWSNYAVDNPAPAAYIPDPFYAVVPPLSFFQRVYNVLLSSFAELTQRIGLFFADRSMRQYFGNDIPCITEIITNTSLLLVNHHPVMTFPRPQTPNTIEVGGMHIYPPKPLPKDLEDFMTSSKHGVILFSLGTNVKSSDLPKETIRSILKGFGKLKENVLWKFEEDLVQVPGNVKIAKWLPQSDILAHPNLKLFITHGGLLSTTEAVYRGVPIVGIPVMADQPINMQHTENAGLGITLEFSELSGETIYNAVTKVLNNPKFREVAKEKSRILRDTPMTALETAVWWMEYVLRNKGAPHLKSPGRTLWWFQRHLIDVHIFLAIVFSVGAVIGCKVLKLTWGKVCSRGSKKNTKQQKKNGSNKKQKKND